MSHGKNTPDGDSSEDSFDGRRQLMLDALADGMTWTEAADRLGVDRRTLHRWCRNNLDLAAAAAKARDYADDSVEALTYQNCLDPGPEHNTLRMFWLKSRRRSVYADRLDVTTAGQPLLINTIEVVRPAGLNDDGSRTETA